MYLRQNVTKNKASSALDLQRGDRLYTSESDERIKIFLMVVYPSIDIQKNQKEITKTFISFKLRKKPLVFMVYTK